MLPFNPHHLRRVLLAAALTCAGRAYATTVTFSDSNFAPASWTTAVAYDVLGVATHAESQVLTGGNPGSYRRVEQSGYGGFPDILVAHILQGAVYNPSVSGAILSLDFHFEANAPDAGLVKPPDPLDFIMMVTQGGKFFIFQGLASLDTTWATMTRTGIPGSAFQTIGLVPELAPDFSAGGGPIGFGFATATHHNIACDSPCNVGGIDNWWVTVNPPETVSNSPEPATGADVLLAALLGMAARRILHSCPTLR
jgi:hypothetical protein